MRLYHMSLLLICSRQGVSICSVRLIEPPPMAGMCSRFRRFRGSFARVSHSFAKVSPSFAKFRQVSIPKPCETMTFVSFAEVSPKFRQISHWFQIRNREHIPAMGGGVKCIPRPHRARGQGPCGGRVGPVRSSTTYTYMDMDMDMDMHLDMDMGMGMGMGMGIG